MLKGRTTIDRRLKPLLQGLTKLVELKIPSTISLQDVSLPSLRRLTILHMAIQESPAPLPEIAGLTHLEIQLRLSIMQTALPIFFGLDGNSSLHTLRLTCTHTSTAIELGTYLNLILFRGYSSSLRYVAVSDPFLFQDFATLKRWLKRVSSETPHSLSLNAIQFGYHPHDVDSSLVSAAWPSVPQLRSLELGDIDPAYFQAFPCFGLRKLFVATK